MGLGDKGIDPRHRYSRYQAQAGKPRASFGHDTIGADVKLEKNTIIGLDEPAG